VVVMNQGAIQQIGDPWALYHRPSNSFVATFVGDANVVPGEVAEVGEHVFTVRIPGLESVFDIARATAADCPAPGDKISVVFRPEWAQVSQEDGLPTRNELRVRLVSSEFLGDHFERVYEAGEYRLRVQAVTGPTSEPPRIGADQTLAIPPENLTWFRRENGLS
jgi:ABC-type Fe3+/spermidine/putrescine transport system ATPase subunit